MTHLVRDRLCRVLLVTSAQRRRKHKVRRVGTPVERPAVRHTTRRAVPRTVAADHHTLTPCVIARANLLQGVNTRILGRDVHIERRVVLRHPLPDVLNPRQLRVAELARVTIKIVRRGGNGLAAIETRVPLRARGDVALKVQIDRLLGSGQALKQKCLRKIDRVRLATRRTTRHAITLVHDQRGVGQAHLVILVPCVIEHRRAEVGVCRPGIHHPPCLQGFQCDASGCTTLAIASVS